VLSLAKGAASLQARVRAPRSLDDIGLRLSM
jgi:hypothetical protein